MNLSPRLLTVAQHVPYGAVLHDVGTDHGYLPIYLLETSHISCAYASDLREEPLKSAAVNGAKWIQKKQLILSLQDGFFPLHPFVTCLTISGLGGPLMSELINAHPESLAQLDTIILQPQTHTDVVRTTLNKYGWKIIDETMVEDSGLIYEIVTWTKGREVLSAQELLFGPILLRQKSTLFIAKWNEEATYLRNLLQQIPLTHPSYQRHQNRLERIEEVL